MPAKHVTVDHEKIKAWAQERSGRPAAATSGHPEDSLRVSFGRRSREELEPISWEEFFRRFEEHNLAFVFQVEAKDGGLSRSYRFVRRKSVGHEGPALQKGPHPIERRGQPAEAGVSKAEIKEEIDDQERWEGESPAASRLPDGDAREDKKPSIGESGNA